MRERRLQAARSRELEYVSARDPQRQQVLLVPPQLDDTARCRRRKHGHGSLSGRVDELRHGNLDLSPLHQSLHNGDDPVRFDAVELGRRTPGEPSGIHVPDLRWRVPSTVRIQLRRRSMRFLIMTARILVAIAPILSAVPARPAQVVNAVGLSGAP